jgi:hypothetical protein
VRPQQSTFSLLTTEITTQGKERLLERRCGTMPYIALEVGRGQEGVFQTVHWSRLNDFNRLNDFMAKQGFFSSVNRVL